MTRAIAVAGLLLIFGTTAGVAERNLIPTLDNHPNVCPDQPPEPKWMQNINVRESYKRLLIQQIYRAQSMERPGGVRVELGPQNLREPELQGTEPGLRRDICCAGEGALRGPGGELPQNCAPKLLDHARGGLPEGRAASDGRRR